MSNQTDTNQASEVKRNSLNKSDRDVKLESINQTGGRAMSKQSKTQTLVYKIDKEYLRRLADWHKLPWYKRIFRRFK